MAVETRYAVVRKGVEVLLTTEKKQADEYDKMLDRADALSEVLHASGCDIAEQQLEKLSIYLAEHRDDVLQALGARKPKDKTKPVQEPTLAAVELGKSSEWLKSWARLKRFLLPLLFLFLILCARCYVLLRFLQDRL